MLVWLPLLFSVCHIVEEFVWPGGFLQWYRTYRPDLAASQTPTFAVAVNAVLLAATGALGVLGLSWSRGLSLLLILVALQAANAVFHIVGVVRLRRYSPGVVTGVALYLPLFAWTYWHAVADGEASLSFAATSLVLGASYQLWSILNHQRRSRDVEVKG